jgi:serine/threonine-protein phosphatase 2A activator
MPGVISLMDIDFWISSNSFRDLLAFIKDIFENPLPNQWETKNDLTDLLESIEQSVDSFNVPQNSKYRYGNREFRPFIEESAFTLIDNWKPLQDSLDDTELKSHLKASFGNLNRIDFGTGHELEFLIFLFLYCKLPLAANSRAQIFYACYPRYYRLQKKIIAKFRLEPAGSRGVWGIDDYFFLPFLFGSTQLINMPSLEYTPNLAVLKKTLENAKAQGILENYLYLRALLFDYEEKGADFSSHSPLLWDLSGLESWSKIATGLLKMYEKEVLSNKTIVQHVKFGILFPCK